MNTRKAPTLTRGWGLCYANGNNEGMCDMGLNPPWIAMNLAFAVSEFLIWTAFGLNQAFYIVGVVWVLWLIVSVMITK